MRYNFPNVDSDTYLWGDTDPDFEGELARAAELLAAGDEGRKAVLVCVADRLLDRVRDRLITRAESECLETLFDDGPTLGGNGCSTEDTEMRAVQFACGDEMRLRWCRELLRKIDRRVALCGALDSIIEDVVPLEIQPLHLPVVREALGSLIPARLHRSLDAAINKSKDTFGVLRGGGLLRMSGWKVNLRTEDALARGRLESDALEFFLNC